MASRSSAPVSLFQTFATTLFNPEGQIRLRLIAEVNQPFFRRAKLSELHAGFFEEIRGFDIHVVALTVHHFCDPHLHDLDAAGEAGARITVQDCASANTLSPSFQQSILLG